MPYEALRGFIRALKRPQKALQGLVLQGFAMAYQAFTNFPIQRRPDGAQHSESPSLLGKGGPGPGARTRARGALYEGKGPMRSRLLRRSPGKIRHWKA